MTERQLLECTGNHDDNPTLNIPCRYIFQHGQKDVHRPWSQCLYQKYKNRTKPFGRRAISE